MNKRMILYIIGVVLVAEAALMLLPAGVALIYAEERALRAFGFCRGFSGHRRSFDTYSP